MVIINYYWSVPPLVSQDVADVLSAFSNSSVSWHGRWSCSHGVNTIAPWLAGLGFQGSASSIVTRLQNMTIIKPSTIRWSTNDYWQFTLVNNWISKASMLGALGNNLLGIHQVHCWDSWGDHLLTGSETWHLLSTSSQVLPHGKMAQVSGSIQKNAPVSLNLEYPQIRVAL